MQINGKKSELQSGITVTELLMFLKLSQSKVVVEVNYEIIEKEKYNHTILNQEDKVEIVSFVGGG